MPRLYVEGKHGRRDVQDVSRLANVLALIGRMIEGGEISGAYRARGEGGGAPVISRLAQRVQRLEERLPRPDDVVIQVPYGMEDPPVLADFGVEAGPGDLVVLVTNDAEREARLVSVTERAR